MPKPPFRYKKLDYLSEPFRIVWEAVDTKTNKSVGFVRKKAENNFATRRLQDAHFDREFGSRREAARWLRDYQTDPAAFGEEASDPN